jgi:ATP-dependent Clp protease ATP-binding subunit ClpA
VDQARRGGASWSEIGRSMGVTKQAAQQRFTPRTAAAAGMDPGQGFTRFTPRARNVVVSAQNEARASSSDVITPAHLVLGLLAEPEALAARALLAQGVAPAALRAAALAVLPAAVPTVPDLVPFDDQARGVLEDTFREALRLGHNYIGTEHILLALLAAEDGEGLLSGVGVDRGAAERFLAEAVAAAAAERN